MEDQEHMTNNENTTKKEEHNTDNELEDPVAANTHRKQPSLIDKEVARLQKAGRIPDELLQVAMVRDNVHVNVSRTEKANSYSWRYGGAGTDGKVYYETPEELATHFEQLATVQERIADAVRRIKAAHTEDKE